MTNSPKLECSDENIWSIYRDNGCDLKMVDCRVDVIERKPFSSTEAAKSGVTEYRCEQRTSQDGTCIIQTDVYVHKDGTEKHFIFNLEINGEDHFVRYEKPGLYR
jgi:hypothetical protein